MSCIYQKSVGARPTRAARRLGRSGGQSGRALAASLLDALEQRRHLSVNLNVNFQPDQAPPFSDYVIDSGLSYGSRGDNLAYGWDETNSTAVDRNSSLSPDQRYDTLIEMASPKNKPRTWELAVPNGTYTVHLVAGDPAVVAGAIYSIDVEGVSAVSASPSRNQRWIEGDVTVDVTDGRLTVSNGAGARGNRLAFLTVTGVAAAPAVPSQLVATAPSATQVALSWQDNSLTETGFVIEQSTDGVNFTEAATVGANVTSAEIAGLAGGSTYHFRVGALSLSDPPQYSQIISVLTRPSAPVLAATSASRTHQLTISWNDVRGEEGYSLHRSSDGGTTWSPVADLAANVTGYQDSGLAEGTMFHYRLVAHNASGETITTPVDATTATFAPYEGTRYTNKPSPLGSGVKPIYVAYEQFLITSGAVDEVKVRTEAGHAADAGQDLVLDIESLPFDIRVSSESEVTDTIAKFKQVIDYVRDEWQQRGATGLRIGTFGVIPVDAPEKLDSAVVAAWQDANDFLDPLVQQLDFLAPNLYTTYGNPSDWAVYSTLMLDEAATRGKPVYPFLLKDFAGYGPEVQTLQTAPLPIDYWLMEQALVRELSDGMVIWEGEQAPWDPQAEWWTATQEFLAAPPTKPAAPSALLLDFSGAHLTWQDNADNEYGFVIERSSDGGATFAHVGMVPRNATTWTDPRLVSGASYTYRVTASNGFGRSAHVQAEGTVTRDALSRNQGEAPEAYSGVSWVGKNFGIDSLQSLDNGDWAAYHNVDFGDGVNQFIAHVGVENELAGQQIEVRLGSVTGTLLNTLSLTPTGGFHRFANQTTSVPLTSGVHDVYLVFKGTWGAGNLDWFGFALNGIPAAPSGMIARSGSARIDLFWTDNSADETGFAIERSTDGTSFTPLAAVEADTTTYVDLEVDSVSTYYYRVRSFNPHGTSDASALASAVATTRDAFSTIEAESFNDMSGVELVDGSVGYLDNGDWLAYYALDFGSTGATKFLVNIALPDEAAGQHIEIRLDGLNGPVIGTLTTVGTGSYFMYEVQITDVTQTIGVHDVYLSFKGQWGIGNIDWLSFR